MNNSKKLVSVVVVSFLVLFVVYYLQTNNRPERDNTQSSGEDIVSDDLKEVAVIKDGNYQVDTIMSKLNWSADRVLSSGHVGSISIKSGDVSVSGEEVTGNFIMDMTTIIADDGLNDILMNHLRSDDFFSVQNFPEADFRLSGLDYDNNSAIVSGALTIKGTTGNIIFPAYISDDAGVYTVVAKITIDRTLWNVRYGSPSFFDDLGDAAIKDDIVFDLTLVLNSVGGGEVVSGGDEAGTPPIIVDIE